MEAPSSTDIFRFDRFHLDRRGLFLVDGEAAPAPVEIGSRALDVLHVLLERPGDLVSRDEIMVAAWPGIVVEDNNLTIQIAALRRVLDQDRANGSCIETVPRRGYRYVGPVTRLQPLGTPESGSPSGNGIDGSLTDSEPAGSGPPSPVGYIPPIPLPRVRRRFWRAIIIAGFGALVLVG